MPDHHFFQLFLRGLAAHDRLTDLLLVLLGAILAYLLGGPAPQP